MAYTVKVTEGDPETRPTISGAPAGVDAAAVWERMEIWTAHRWGARTVEYIAEGPGDWFAPLAPSTITETEVWTGAAWEAVTLDPSPFGGYVLDAQGPYRFTGTVGAAGAPPAAVAAAWLRLAEYWSHLDQEQAAITGGGDGDYSFRRASAWQAKALIYSGAADLLRRWRRP